MEQEKTQNKGDLPPIKADNKIPARAIVSLVLGIIGIAIFYLPFLGFVIGFTALILAIFARKKIRSSARPKGRGTATAGFILGIISTVLGILVLMIFIPNYLNIGKRPPEYFVQTNMRVVRSAMDRFQADADGFYAESMDDTTLDGVEFSAMLREFELKNPFTRKPAAVVFMQKNLSVFPSDSFTLNIPPGDINIFSDGRKYMILAGDRRGRSMDYRLKSWMPDQQP